MEMKTSINNGLDNGLMPDSTQPLLTQVCWRPSLYNFIENAQAMLVQIIIWNWIFKNIYASARGQWVNPLEAVYGHGRHFIITPLMSHFLVKVPLYQFMYIVLQ